MSNGRASLRPAREPDLDRAARGMGVGALLLAHAERFVVAAGHDHAWLAVATGNRPGRRFYARQGWTDEGRFDHPAPAPGGPIPVDCHRFVSPPRPPHRISQPPD